MLKSRPELLKRGSKTDNLIQIEEHREPPNFLKFLALLKMRYVIQKKQRKFVKICSQVFYMSTLSY